MARFFNTAGPCRPDKHYMLPPERRLPNVRDLVDQEAYFVIHAPRQTGKTTLIRALAHQLTGEGRYAAVHVSCEAAQAAGEEVETGIAVVVREIAEATRLLPAELRPESVDALAGVEAGSLLKAYLTRWAERCPRPLVLLLDEIDALVGNTLISVLRQLRAGYPERPEHFPHSVALIGLRDVRDYRLAVRPEVATLGTASPFNIKVESLILRDFDAGEVAELVDQHRAETGQAFTEEASARIFELTQGQPWLVNALARQAVQQLADRRCPIGVAEIDAAKEAMIQRRDTHLDSLIDRLREPRVRRVIEPILSGDFLSLDVLDDDVRFARDLGLIRTEPMLAIANPIYREVIPRALTWLTESQLPVVRASFVDTGGRLVAERLLDGFTAFWCQHAEAFLQRQPYAEAAAQLIFMAWLQKVVNGGNEHGLASIEREYAVGSGRIDLEVRWPHPGGLQRWALELKVWRDGQADPEAAGLEQLSRYLERLALEAGTLVVFDSRTTAPPLPGRCARREVIHQGRRITVLRL